MTMWKTTTKTKSRARLPSPWVAPPPHLTCVSRTLTRRPKHWLRHLRQAWKKTDEIRLIQMRCLLRIAKRKWHILLARGPHKVRKTPRWYKRPRNVPQIKWPWPMRKWGNLSATWKWKVQLLLARRAQEGYSISRVMVVACASHWLIVALPVLDQTWGQQIDRVASSRWRATNLVCCQT